MPAKDATTKPTLEDRQRAQEARVAERAARRAEFHDETAERREQTRRGHLRRQAPDRILIRAKSPAVFEITVDDKGKLNVAEIAPAELTKRA